jgi:hypothetical protein
MSNNGVRLESIFAEAGDPPARRLTVFALLGLGVVESLDNGLMSATDAADSSRTRRPTSS